MIPHLIPAQVEEGLFGGPPAVSLCGSGLYMCLFVGEHGGTGLRGAEAFLGTCYSECRTVRAVCGQGSCSQL